MIDNALASNIDTASMNLKFILAGEVFSEEWRSMIMRRCSISSSDIVAIYGTADAGILGCETPLSIELRIKVSICKVTIVDIRK